MPLPVRDYDRNLNSELERLLYQVDVIVLEAEGLLQGLSESQFQWSPGTGVWSMERNFNHLNVVNSLYLQLFKEAVERGRTSGMLSDGPYSYGLFGRWFLRQVTPPVRHKVGAPKRFQPGSARRLADLMEEWKQGQVRFSELLRSANGLDLARIKVPSPITGLLRYNLGIAFWVKTAHDRRHLWQARQVRNHPNFPQQA